jgi:hypothetical protein
VSGAVCPVHVYLTPESRPIADIMPNKAYVICGHVGSRQFMSKLLSRRRISLHFWKLSTAGLISFHIPFFPADPCPLWVMCGRCLGKNFLTLLQH